MGHIIVVKVTEYKKAETTKNEGTIEYQNEPKKENESHTELLKSDDNIITEIIETIELFNKLRRYFFMRRTKETPLKIP